MKQCNRAFMFFVILSSAHTQPQANASATALSTGFCGLGESRGAFYGGQEEVYETSQARDQSTGRVAGLPVMLKVNNLQDPLGIDTPTPTFAWMIEDKERNEHQTAFRVIVASSGENVLKGVGDIWDSKKTPSSEQVSIPYSGSRLQSRTKYWWAVKTWDKDGNESVWSSVSSFETAFLDPSDWKAKLVGGPYERYRKEFVSSPSKVIARARAYVSAMGLYEVRINGKKIGKAVLEPNLADFRKRLWYSTYDISRDISTGKNVVGVAVGGGYVGRVWHTPADRKFILQIEISYTDGSADMVVSDSSWKMTASGPILTAERNNIYDGEKYDARNEDDWDHAGFDDSSWISAAQATLSLPGDKLRASLAPPMKVVSTITPTMKKLFPGIYVFDMGQNITGWAQLNLKGKRGEKVDMRFGEDLATLWNNYAYEADVTILEKSAGLSFRIVDEDNMYLWKVTSSGRLQSFKKVDGTLRQLQDIDIGVAAHTTFHVRIDVNGSSLSTFVNGRLVNSIMDDTFASGKIGFVQGPDERAAFDNVSVKSGSTTLFTTDCRNLNVWMNTANAMVDPDGRMVVTNNQSMRSLFGNVDGGVTQESCSVAGIIISTTSGGGNADQHDVYILRGGGDEIWEPRFTNHGFRYVEVRYPGALDVHNLRGRVVHQAVNENPARVGSFECSNALLNTLYQASLWSIRGALQFGMPIDCPQRDERHGWTGDAEACSRAALSTFDMSAFYSHWFQDIRDTQRDSTQPGTGYVDNINPRQGEISNAIEEDVPWSSACINVPWDLYLCTGDKEIIKKQYPSMKAFLQWCQDTDNPDFTTDKDCWGDHTSVIQATVNKRLLATAFYYLSAARLSTMAKDLGYVSDAASFASLADRIKTAFNASFLHENACYGSGQQTQQALALAFGLCPDSARNAVLKHLVKDIVDRDTLMTVGILGTYALFDALCDNGRSDIAFSLVKQTAFPSWGNFIKRGATTMWEFWDGAGSHNHPFLGGCLPRFFYERLAGVSPTEPGYRRFVVKPTVVGDIRHVNATIPTVRGNVVSNWKREDDGTFNITVTIPVNSQAEIFVPALGRKISALAVREGKTTIFQKGKPAKMSEGIVYERIEDEYVVFRAGSGTYDIKSDAR